MDNKEQIIKKFRNIFFRKPDYLFSCGGRFEILGNHTDHNHGLCLAATCNLAITAAVKKASIYNKIAFTVSPQDDIRCIDVPVQRIKAPQYVVRRVVYCHIVVRFIDFSVLLVGPVVRRIPFHQIAHAIYATLDFNGISREK